MCLATDQLDIATKFVHSKVKTRYDDKSYPLWQNHKIIGWPSTLNGDCKIAWDFIKTLPKKWDWLNNPFGDLSDYQSYLCAYYMGLNILELAETIALDKSEIVSEQGGLSLDIPLCFLQEDENITLKGYRLLLRDPQQLRGIWRSLNVDDSKMEELWPHWIRHSKQWLINSSKWPFIDNIIAHANLFQDLS